MTTLVEDLLLLARIDEGREIAQLPVDMAQIVTDSVMDAHVNAPKHHFELDIAEGADGDYIVIGDESRLRQIVVNLLANVRVHTPEGTTCQVKMHETAAEITLEISDDGPGVSSELRERVFDRFARGDSSRSRKLGSSGLGLAIVQSLVLAHHGSIELGVAQPDFPESVRWIVRLPRAVVRPQTETHTRA